MYKYILGRARTKQQKSKRQQKSIDIQMWSSCLGGGPAVSLWRRAESGRVLANQSEKRLLGCSDQ